MLSFLLILFYPLERYLCILVCTYIYETKNDVTLSELMWTGGTEMGWRKEKYSYWIA